MQNISKKLQSMFRQINQILSSMLSNLTYIYKTNGIQYEVQKYHQVLMRIITPIQILNSEKNSILCSQMQEQNSAFWKENKSNLTKTRRDFNFDDDLTRRQEKEKRGHENSQRGRGSHLGDKIQSYLCEWALKKAKKGFFVQKGDIIFEACRIASKNGINFQGSSGWFVRFLSRNPEMKSFLQNQRTRPQNHRFPEIENMIKRIKEQKAEKEKEKQQQIIHYGPKLNQQSSQQKQSENQLDSKNENYLGRVVYQALDKNRSNELNQKQKQVPDYL